MDDRQEIDTGQTEEFQQASAHEEVQAPEPVVVQQSWGDAFREALPYLFIVFEYSGYAATLLFAIRFYNLPHPPAESFIYIMMSLFLAAMCGIAANAKNYKRAFIFFSGNILVNTWY